MKQTILDRGNEIDKLLFDRKHKQMLIDHYRVEYKKVRMMVRDAKRAVREINLRIKQLSEPTQDNTPKV